MGPSERKARELAEQQHAIINLDDLRDSRVSIGAKRFLLESGRFDALHRGTYRVVGAPQTPYQPIAAAVLASGDGLASHFSAAFLYALRGVELRQPEITVVGTSVPRLRGVRIHRTDRLDPPDRGCRMGIACTSMTRLLLDIGWRTTDLAFERIVSDARFQGYISLDQLWRALDRLGKRGRRGTARLRSYLQSEAPNRPPESELELRALRLLRVAGVPAPTAQHWVHVGGVWMRIDLAYPELKIAIELDGLSGRPTKADFERNSQKKTLLTVAGWTTLHFTWSDVMDRPEWVVAQVLAVLRAAGV